jgi:signal transduction histidine kinase/DNA-binding NarL/FixJ family response regulator
VGKLHRGLPSATGSIRDLPHRRVPSLEAGPSRSTWGPPAADPPPGCHAARPVPSDPRTDPLPSGPATADPRDELHLDRHAAERHKRERDRRYQTRELPRMRVLGFVLLLVLVALHQSVGGPEARRFSVFALGAFLATYAAASSYALKRWYRRDGRIHLGRFFLLADLVPLGGAVWATGASQSWLFLLPYVRVFDQVHIGLRWCLTCTALATLTHVTVIGSDLLGGRPVLLEREAMEIATCTTIAIYISLTSLTAEKLRRRNSRSVALARDLVMELQDQQHDLEQARKAAETAAIAKGAFLATMSHEIRTPMNGVLGMISLARESENDQERNTLLATAECSAVTLLQVLGDVLDFSKIEAGHVAVERGVIDVRELVHQGLQLVSIQARAKGLALTSQVAEDVPEAIVGDPLRTRQILLNLLGNAVKFTEDGQVCVRVTRILDASGVPQIVWSVTDTGIGIATSQLESIFEAFTQAEMSTSRRYGGTGLGLSISRRLAELMGGRLFADSVPSEGSTFTLVLPLEAAPAAESTGSGSVETHASEPRPLAERIDEPPPALPASAEAKRPKSRCSARALEVLLVEDNPINQRVARLQLERWGHRVAVAENGLVAVQLAESGRFDCVLMDMQMPEMDGIEATVALRRADIRSRAGAALPIVAMTANVMDSDRERCLAVGMDDYLAKPIQIDALFALLEGIAAHAVVPQLPARDHRPAAASTSATNSGASRNDA